MCDSSSDCESSDYIDPLRKICPNTNNNCLKVGKCVSQVQKYNPDVDYFSSMVMPVSDLQSEYTTTSGCAEFKMRRKNKTVILQWRPFTGTMAASGVAYLQVCQSICNVPCYPVVTPIFIQYKGEDRVVKCVIDPFIEKGQILFYLNTDGSSNNIAIGDAFKVYGGNVQWVIG